MQADKETLFPVWGACVSISYWLLYEESSSPVDTWKSGEKGKKESTYDAMRAIPEDALQKSKQN